ncbi:MAG: hypothetical protein JXR56_06085 [Candidatus Cloacimonetes bacterium]|nr:hypothetical protein [Candidatus Cloacimonadota bacterium]
MKTLGVLIILCISITLFAGETDVRLGLIAGPLSGAGVGCRVYFGDFGIQVAGITYKAGEKDSYDYSRFTNVGVQGIFTISTYSILRFYAFGGISHVYWENYYEYDRWSYWADNYVRETHYDYYRETHFGGGPGLEFNVSRNSAIVLEYPVYYTTDDEVVLELPQIGLFYRF